MSADFILTNLEKYNSPTKDDICVGLCYFNPIGYKNTRENLEIVLSTLKNSNIPYFIIELIYPGQDQSIPDATKIVRAKTILFSKENLWNILEKSIPKKYSKIIFLDADIKFSNPDWINLASNKLDVCNVIQPMDVVYRDLTNKYFSTIAIQNDLCRYSVAYMIEQTNEACPSLHHPGFSIGIDRNLLHEMGGFFEYGVNGNGDSLFWMAVSNFYSTATGKYLQSRKDISIKFYDYKAKIERLNIKVGAVFDNLAIHLYHGKLDLRKYLEREKYINTKLYDNFYHNNEGVLEMMYDMSVYQYFLDRKEDE